MKNCLVLVWYKIYTMDGISVVIMAGGQGKRFGTGKVKVLQEIFGKPMLVHIIENVEALNPIKIMVIVGNYKQVIENTLIDYIGEKRVSRLCFVNQPEAKGTGHALQCCMEELKTLDNSKVLVLSGDTPMMRLFTMRDIISIDSDAVLTVRDADNPFGYGRIITKDGMFEKIVEEKDANTDEKAVNLVNCGIYCIRSDLLVKNLPLLRNDNAQQEYYLTDVVKLIKDNEKVDISLFKISKKNEYEVMGVNTPEELELLIARMSGIIV